MSSTPPQKLQDDPEISFRQTMQVFAKLISYLSLFKVRIFTKLGFITFEHVLRILLLPWPLKIIVDHVILGEPIACLLYTSQSPRDTRSSRMPSSA